MSIQEKIDARMKESLKSKDVESLSLFRMLKSALKNAEIAKKGELDDNDVIAVLEKEAKQRRDSIAEYKKGGREDLAKKEERELAIIEGFLPEKMSEEEIRQVVKEKIENAGENAQFGPIMGQIMGELKGKADGSLVQKIVKEELGA